MNKLHILLWKLREKFIKKRHNRFSPLRDRAYMMQHKINHAKLFGGAKLAFFGDSNGENIDYDDLSMFKKIAINISVAGTRLDDWFEFFSSRDGIEIYKQLLDIETIVVNLSGNHVLQNSMSNFVEYFDKIFAMFPDAYYITVPKIHSKILEKIKPEKRATQINQEIMFVNNYIKRKAKEKTIDIYPLTTANDVEPFVFVHSDLVHFSKEFDQKVRIPFIKSIIE